MSLCQPHATHTTATYNVCPSFWAISLLRSFFPLTMLAMEGVLWVALGETDCSGPVSQSHPHRVDAGLGWGTKE